MSEITILLSVYKKAPYLKDFLMSLQRQSFLDFTLLCRFDDPEDNQYNKQLLNEFPFTQILEDESHLCVVKTYNALLQSAGDSPYLMFADQDDVWHEDKLERTLAVMKQAEADTPAGTPILCHSDLRVVDRDLQEISPSFMKFQSLDSKRDKFRELLIQNNVTGCTVMINRSLAQLVDFPEDTICHDWYLALVASAFGTIRYIDSALIDYRQHGGNCYGAVPRKKLLAAFYARKELNGRLLLTQKQAGAFLSQFKDQLTEEKRDLAAAWSRIPNEKFYLKRLFTAWKYRFAKNDFIRTVGLWWAL